MKSISDLKRQLDNLVDLEIDLLNPPVASSAKAKNKAKFLTTCIRYLESAPSDDFIEKEVKRIGQRIHEIMRVYGCWATDKTFDSDEKRLAAYRNYYGVPQLETQLDCLKFLLG